MITMNNLIPKYNIKFVDNYGHWYQIEGDERYLPSVTAILKYSGSGDKLKALMEWSKKIALQHVSEELKKQLNKEIEITEFFIDNIIKAGKQKPQEFFEKAGDVGSRVHSKIDYFIKYNKTPPLEEDEKVAYNNFLEWLKDNKLTIIDGDTVCASKIFGYGGRMDCIAKNDNEEYVLIDFKTSNRIKGVIDYIYQIAAYSQALTETFGINVNKGVIIRFDKVKNEYETVVVDNLQYYFEGFKALLKLKEISEKEVK